MGPLREQVVPRVSQAPGFIAGYWTRKENTGLSMVVFESEDAANGASEQVAAMVPDGVTLESIEVRERSSRTPKDQARPPASAGVDVLRSRLTGPRGRQAANAISAGGDWWFRRRAACPMVDLRQLARAS